MALDATAYIRRTMQRPALVAALVLVSALTPVGLQAANRASTGLQAPNRAPAGLQVQAASRAPAVSAPNTWASTGSMTITRAMQTSTLLPDGQVLVAGGCRGYCLAYYTSNATAIAELYNPSTGTFTSTGSMIARRMEHTATLLQDGQVLVAGGCCDSSGHTLASAELYDPSTGTWTATGSMTTPRASHTATLLSTGQVLVAGGGPASAELYDPATGTWTATGAMATPRTGQTATLLTTGNVLVAGGDYCYTGCSVPNAELYDPATGTWTATGNMINNRTAHTATLLPNGQVLVTGGFTCCSWGTTYATGSAELYDPATGTWAATSSMATARAYHMAVLLNSGRVLVAGGEFSHPGNAAELYDPSTGTWTATSLMSRPRQQYTATLLPDGQVLVAGGCCTGSGDAWASAELYTAGAGPLVNTSASQVAFVGQRIGTSSPVQTLTLTNTGLAPLLVSSVAISGSAAGAFTDTTTCTAAPIAPQGTCRIALQYTPTITGTATAGITITDNAPTSPQIVALSGSGRGPNAWSGTGFMTTGRADHTATLLSDGQVLVAGGEAWRNDSIHGYFASAELYDPRTETWAPTGRMNDLRAYQTATLLSSGQVLVAGGEDCPSSGICRTTATAELYDPHTGTWTFTGAMAHARQAQTATLLPNGTVLVAGGCGNATFACGTINASAEIYDPHTGTWTAAGSMLAYRQNHTATLLPNGKILVAGGCCSPGSGNSLASAELYDPRTGTWAATGTMAHPRVYHTATLLPSGKVLVAGGEDCGIYECAIYTSAELYDPATGTWAATGAMSNARDLHTATLLPNGQVLVAGGPSNSSASAELYDPNSGTWSPTGNLLTGRIFHTATLLPGGNVLVAGGLDSSISGLAEAELYTPVLLMENPTSGTYGQTLVLSGTNFYAHETVNIYPDSTSNPVLYSASTDAHGSFVLTDTVRQGTYGVHTLIAVGESSGGSTSVPFTVQPALTLSPTSGTSGTTVTATGYGFGAKEPVALHWSSPTGPSLGSAMSNGFGTFANAGAITFTVPAGANVGTYQVYAIGQTSGAQGVATFTVH